MMRMMTEEEVATKKKQVDDLYNSTDLEDNVCAILMDVTVGQTGFHEGTARTKAAIIMELIEKGKLPC